jgi:hypothetical protein
MQHSAYADRWVSMLPRMPVSPVDEVVQAK